VLFRSRRSASTAAPSRRPPVSPCSPRCPHRGTCARQCSRASVPPLRRRRRARPPRRASRRRRRSRPTAGAMRRRCSAPTRSAASSVPRPWRAGCPGPGRRPPPALRARPAPRPPRLPRRPAPARPSPSSPPPAAGSAAPPASAPAPPQGSHAPAPAFAFRSTDEKERSRRHRRREKRRARAGAQRAPWLSRSLAAVALIAALVLGGLLLDSHRQLQDSEAFTAVWAERAVSPGAELVPGISDNGTWQAVLAEDGVALRAEGVVGWEGEVLELWGESDGTPRSYG